MDRRGGLRRWALVAFGLLGLSGGTLPAGSPVQAATSDRRLVVVDDTQVNSADRTANLSASPKMTMCTSCDAPGGPTKRGLLKFDTSAVTGTVVRVRLRLYSLGSAATRIEVQETTTNWTGPTVNWETAPPKGADRGASLGGEPTGWIEIELDKVGTGAYVIETSGTAPIRVASAESATPPELIVTTETAGPPRMNVVLIVTDDQRDWPTTQVMMPKTLGWLGGGGRTFTNAFVTTPSCCPSRSSIFTGQYVHNHGVRLQTLGASLDQSETVQRYLKDAGYNTAMAGKYLNGWDLSQRPAYFDRSAVAQGGYVNQVWGIDGVTQVIPDYTTKFISDKAVEYLDGFEATDSTPFFLYLATFAPHKPHTPEPKYAGIAVPTWAKNAAVNDSTSDKAVYLSGNAQIPAAEIDAFREAQQRTLPSVDDMVSRVMKKLEATGEIDNTIVIYTSDNGYHWGEHRYIGKFTPYMPSLRVPLLVRWPGRYAGGSSSSKMVANIDIAPTILSAVGLPTADKPMDGRPFTSPGRDRLHIEYWFDSANGPLSAPTWRATLTPTYEFVRNVNRDGSYFYEYYDLVADPWQTTNLYANGTTADDPPLDPLLATQSADHRCATTTCP